MPRCSVIAIAAFSVAVMALAVMTIRLIRTVFHSDTLFGAALIIFLAAAGFLLRRGEQQRPGDLDGKRQEIALRLSG